LESTDKLKLIYKFKDMNQQLAYVAVLVNDYDEAIEFYTEKLHFRLIEDKLLGETKRWVLVRPQGPGDVVCYSQKKLLRNRKEWWGNQTGGRVFLFLYTDNFKRDYQNLIDHSIDIVREPVDEPYGKVAVFKDLYGNLWDLIEPVG